ncbi:MAG TPA: acetyl-CoA C-acetyltransferase, partial [Polyangiales bacterium]|nr:acetyl-CoA C-acetyltransferase [Polyangiales bacterium]
MMKAVIVGAARTPIGKFQGALSSFSAPQLGALCIQEALRRADVAGADVQELHMGNVLSAGVGQAPARQAGLQAGLSEHVPTVTVNKVCGSGLQAVIHGTRSVLLGDHSLVVAGGMESMSNA